MAYEKPTFKIEDVAWGLTVLIQSVIMELVKNKMLTAESAQQVFDAALERTRNKKNGSPGAAAFVQHAHDDMLWDNIYMWSAQQRRTD